MGEGAKKPNYLKNRIRHGQVVRHVFLVGAVSDTQGHAGPITETVRTLPEQRPGIGVLLRRREDHIGTCRACDQLTRSQLLKILIVVIKASQHVEIVTDLSIQSQLLAPLLELLVGLLD